MRNGPTRIRRIEERCLSLRPDALLRLNRHRGRANGTQVGDSGSES